jgi:WD40 repeat protein
VRLLRAARLRLPVPRRHALLPRKATPYNAFLSYGREADAALAPRLRAGLQAFARPWNQLRALRVFVDDASLSANPGLWPAIEQAIDASEFLLLLASPDAASSRYVAKEAAHWQSSKPEGRILIALTEGDILWDDAQADFDWTKTTALPPTLGGAFMTEPRWVDLRWARGSDSLSLRDDRFRNAVADLAATLHHRDKDELLGEDVRQHRRTTLLARGAVLTLAALTVSTTFAAVSFLRERDKAREQTRVALSGQLAAQSQLVRDTRVDRALLLGVAALGARSTSEARSALFGALEREPRLLRMLWADRATSGPVVFVPPTGRLVAVGSGGDVTLWDSRSGRRVRTLRSALSGVSTLSVSSRGELLAAGGANGAVVWDLRSAARTGRSVPVEEVLAMTFSRDGRLAIASSDDSIRIWDRGLKRSREVAPARGTGAVAAMTSDPSGRRLVTVGRNGDTQIWNTGRRGQPRTLAPAPSAGALVSVAWHEDEIAAGTDAGRVVRWTTRHPSTARIVGDGARPISGVAFSPGGGLLAAADGVSVVLMEAADGKLVDRFATSGLPRSVAFSPDGSMLATSGATASVSVWSSRAIRPLARELHVRHDVVTELAFDRQGHMLAAGTRKGAVLVWETRSGRPTTVARAAGDEVWALGFDAAAAKLAAGNLDGSVRVLDPRRGNDLRPAVDAGEAGIDAVAFDGAGRLRATGGHGHLWIWPSAARRTRARRMVADSSQTSLSTDGLMSAFVTGEGTVVLRGLGASRPRRRTLRTGEANPAIRLDSRGDVVAVGGVDTISIWDTDSGRRRIGPLTAVTDPQEGVVSIAVADGASSLATGDTKGDVKIWDGATASSLGTPLDIARGAIGGLAMSDDGRRLAVAAKPGVVLITLEEDDWRQRACAVANRGLSAGERALVGANGVVSSTQIDPCAIAPRTPTG